MFLNAIAAMKIAGEYENIPLWEADWLHCIDFVGDTTMIGNGSNSFKIAGKCGYAPFHCIVWPGLMAAQWVQPLQCVHMAVLRI